MAEQEKQTAEGASALDCAAAACEPSAKAGASRATALPDGAFGSGAQLADLSREQLEELVCIYAKNMVALDGVWFQAVEREAGMAEAMRYNNAAWERFPASDARRVKKFLGLGEHPGLEGLAAALPLKFNSIANHYDMSLSDGVLRYRVLDCRVQTARTRKGMPLHPCKETGLREFRTFARTIDERISCTCESCHPDVADETCSCSWTFALDGE